MLTNKIYRYNHFNYMVIVTLSVAHARYLSLLHFLQFFCVVLQMKNSTHTFLICYK